MALFAANPVSIPIDQANDIYNKYFPQSDKAQVMRVYQNIIRGSSPTRSPNFANITVDLDGNDDTCGDSDGKNIYVNTDGSTKITICPVFWHYIGHWPRKTCSEIGTVTSWAMMIPGAAILHEFT